ncbi:MAG: F0F1 ATP synthase subunit A, partial [Chloroflexota bacterium]|nr:F0F1 ATP synthase subunit A [Chloroflexota bacterium]
GLFVLGARKASLVPGRFQNFVEIAIEGLLNFVAGTVGREHSRLIFPVIATIFLFVIINAWIGLLPIYPSLGFKHDDVVQIHLLRPAGTDINMPLALALVSFFFVEWLGLKMLGLSYITKFVRVTSLKQGMGALFRFQFLDAFQGLLDFFFVGPLEAFSEFVRLISFTFRLFGNMTAGEILVLVSAFLVPFVATVGVYGLELLVGFIQALIFSGLTLVFAAIAITSHHAEEAHH